MTAVGSRQMSDKHGEAADHSLEGIVKYPDRPIGSDRNCWQCGRRLTIVHEHFGASHQNVTIRKFVAFLISQLADRETVTLNRLVEDAVDYIDRSIGRIDSQLIKTT